MAGKKGEIVGVGVHAYAEKGKKRPVSVEKILEKGVGIDANDKQPVIVGAPGDKDNLILSINGVETAAGKAIRTGKVVRVSK